MAAQARTQRRTGRRRTVPAGTAGWRGLAVAACLALLAGHAAPAQAEAQRPEPGAVHGEYAIKAAFLYNFARFTQWPEEAYASTTAPITICVLGPDPFGAALDAIAGKRIQLRPVGVRRIAEVEQASGCQILFIGRSARDRVASWLARLANRPILTVTEVAAPNAGMIDFRRVADHIRFRIDTEHAAGAGLRFSAKLLSLSETYAQEAAPRLGPRPDGAGPQG